MVFSPSVVPEEVLIPSPVPGVEGEKQEFTLPDLYSRETLQPYADMPSSVGSSVDTTHAQVAPWIPAQVGPSSPAIASESASPTSSVR